MQRRKKKTTDSEKQPAPPPLQPAYFEAEQPQSPPPDFPGAESSDPEPGTARTETSVDVDAEATDSQVESRAQPARPVKQTPAAGESQPTRRRRRGGRGRGGRGREQAVAQAFTPAVVKGIVPEVPGKEVEDATESAEPAMEVPAAQQPTDTPTVVPTAPARPLKGIVVLAIGLPGSGKSTWFKRHNVTPLSSDMMRAILFDDVREQRFQDLVFSNLRAMLKARLIAKRPMNYVDATNLTPQERQHWIKLAKDYNYEVQAVFFDVPLDVCLERHQRRDRVVPEDIMRRMAAKLKPPSFEEGFAKITVVRVKKKAEA